MVFSQPKLSLITDVGFQPMSPYRAIMYMPFLSPENSQTMEKIVYDFIVGP